MALDLQFPILYVRDLEASVAFYAAIVGDPVERSPGFAMFVFDSGARLGLWTADAVAPKPEGGPGACELSAATSRAMVDALHAQWAARGVAIAQAPTQMDFGYTFAARDPDGHRLRVFAPGD